jgi:hypothetical protein
MATPELPSMSSPCPCSYLCPSGSRSFLPNEFMVPLPGERRIQRKVVHMPPLTNTRGSSGQKQNRGGEVAADELCFLPARDIERGLFNLPSMNTRSCLLAQTRKEGSGSRPVGPDKDGGLLGYTPPLLDFHGAGGRGRLPWPCQHVPLSGTGVDGP